jgi:hypothetical protein
MKWISVKKKLPKQNWQYYLVWNSQNMEGSEIQIQSFINNFTKSVTHWTPLPEPPKP